MKITKLSTICKSVSETFDNSKEFIVLVNTGDVEEGLVLNHEIIENKNIKGQFKKTFRQDDILYSEIRPINKHYAFINFDAENYVASTKLMVIRPETEKINPKFLYYFLADTYTIEYLQLLAETRSGTFPQITFSEIQSLEINLPNLDIQEKIIKLIESIDSKKELNKSINNNYYLSFKMNLSNFWS